MSGETPEWDRLDHGTPSDDEPVAQSGGLHRESEGVFAEPVQAEHPRRGAGLWVLLTLVLLAAALLSWFWWRSGSSPAPPAVTAAEPAPKNLPEVMPDEEEPEETQVELDLPDLSASDELVRRLAAALSSHPRLAEVLVGEQLVARTVGAVANIAYDEDPKSHFEDLRPEGVFSADPLAAERSGDGLQQFGLSPDGMARYDSAVAVFASLDPAGTVDLYRRLQPLFEQAHRELGLPGTFEQTLRRAVARLRRTPEVADPKLERRRPRSYQFSDPQLESLAEAQKLLLRMGPENRRRVMDQISRLMKELDSR